MKLKYLITGTGRSGTVNAAKLFNSIGIPCSHECLFTNLGYVENNKINSNAAIWCNEPEDFDLIEAESSYMAAPFLANLDDKIQIIHMIRHPIDVISSFLNGLSYFKSSSPRNPYEEFIYFHLPSLKGCPTPIERAAEYYLQWNQMIEYNSFGKKYILHRVEDGNKSLLQKLGFYMDDKFYDEKKCNSVPYKPIGSSEIRKIEDRLSVAFQKYNYRLKMNKDFL